MLRWNPIDHEPTESSSSNVSNCFASHGEAIRSALTPAEIDLLARYVGLHHTQQRISDEDHKPRPTVSYQIRRAAAKLASVGINVPLKGKGRRPKVRAFAMDPAAIERTTETGNDIDGFSVRRWIDGRQIDQVDDD